MTSCPVCETPAAPGTAECEVCGRRLRAIASDAAPASGAEWLETTRFEPVALEAAPIPDLEPTRTEEAGRPTPAGDDAAFSGSWLERTACEPVPEEHLSAPGPEVVCRYCRIPAPPGAVLCDRCGMRLPVRTGAPAGRGGAPSTGVCPACATVGTGPLCPACGVRLAFAP